MSGILPGVLAPRQHICTVSAGFGSYMAAQRVIQRRGTKDLRFLFTDVLIEDRSAYRFLIESICHLLERPVPAHWLAVVDALPEPFEDMAARMEMLKAIRNGIGSDIPELVWIADGRHPHQVFVDEAYLGNSRIDPCSKLLKRRLASRWLDANCDRENTTVYVGIDWTEEHRLVDVRRAREGWTYEAPLCDAPLVPVTWKRDLLAVLERLGITLPELYLLGFAHNNCGGACVKAGQAQWVQLLTLRRALFLWWEAFEEWIRQGLGDVAMLVDRRGGVRKPLTLRALRLRVEGGGEFDRYDYGGCGCALPVVEDNDQSLPPAQGDLLDGAAA